MSQLQVSITLHHMHVYTKLMVAESAFLGLFPGTKSKIKMSDFVLTKVTPWLHYSVMLESDVWFKDSIGYFAVNNCVVVHG